MDGENPPQQYSAMVAEAPLDRGRLRAELSGLGLRAGMTVLVHSSMRRVGWVEGGATTLRDVLLDIVGDEGTLVVPAQTRSKSVTSQEFRDAVAGLDEKEYELYLTRLPGFDAKTSPSEGMGALAEAVRTHPEACRSPHPTTSFAAVGVHAAEVCATHPLDCLLGSQSPLGLLAKLDARVLLLGVGFDKCTAFHLGEDRGLPEERPYRCKIGDEWREFRALSHRDGDFSELGARFVRTHSTRVRDGWVGAARARLFPLALAADFAELELPALRFVR